jgi:hypothetical protein
VEPLADIFFRYLTRYFVPGLVFLVVSLIWPLTLLDRVSLVHELQLDTVPVGVSLALVFGFILDSIGSYRWTPRFRAYSRYRGFLLSTLARDTGIEDGYADPDDYLTDVFIKKPKTFNRLFSDRAEWVMVLETSVCLELGALILVGGMVTQAVQGQRENLAPLLAFICLYGALSRMSASKGIQRMRAHNAKVAAAVASLAGSDSASRLMSPPRTRDRKLHQVLVRLRRRLGRWLRVQPVEAAPSRRDQDDLGA